MYITDQIWDSSLMSRIKINALLTLSLSPSHYTGSSLPLILRTNTLRSRFTILTVIILLLYLSQSKWPLVVGEWPWFLSILRSLTRTSTTDRHPSLLSSSCHNDWINFGTTDKERECCFSPKNSTEDSGRLETVSEETLLGYDRSTHCCISLLTKRDISTIFVKE